MNTPEKLKSFTSFHIHRISKMMMHVGNRRLTGSGQKVQMEQVPVLMLLHFSGDKSQQEIANLLSRDKSAIQRTVKSLEKHKLVEVKPDPFDMRKNLVHISPEGRKITNRIEGFLEDMEQQVLLCLSPEEKDTLLALLLKVEKHIEDKVADPDAEC